MKYHLLGMLCLMTGLMACIHRVPDDSGVKQQAVRNQAHFILKTPNRTVSGRIIMSVASDGRFFCELQHAAGISVALVSLNGSHLELLDLSHRCYMKTGLFRGWIKRELGIVITGEMLWEWVGILPGLDTPAARSYRTAEGVQITVRWMIDPEMDSGKLELIFPDRHINIVLDMEYSERDDPEVCRWSFDRTQFSECKQDPYPVELF